MRDNLVSQGEAGRKEKFKKRVIPFFSLLLVIAISLGLFFYGRNPAVVAELRSLGYLGAFLVSLIGNATVLLPGIVLPILSGLGIVLYPVTGLPGPVVVGLAGGIGAAIGEIVGYMAGYSGRGIVENNRLYMRLVDWVRRWGTLAIFLFTLLPLFFDLVGLAAGVLRFPLWKFVLVCWLGRTLLYVSFVVIAALGWEVVLPYFA
jgi:membrane protein DedA with SNARE-associated domain